MVKMRCKEGLSAGGREENRGFVRSICASRFVLRADSVDMYTLGADSPP